MSPFWFGNSPKSFAHLRFRSSFIFSKHENRLFTTLNGLRGSRSSLALPLQLCSLDRWITQFRRWLFRTAFLGIAKRYAHVKMKRYANAKTKSSASDSERKSRHQTSLHLRGLRHASHPAGASSRPQVYDDLVLYVGLLQVSCASEVIRSLDLTFKTNHAKCR